MPESTEPIRHLVRIMDFYRGRARLAGINGPVLIHCSAGIGRTGTYLAIVFALNAIKHMKQQEASTAAKGSGSQNGGLISDSPQKNGKNGRRVQFGTESPSYSTDEDDESSAEDPRSARSRNSHYSSTLGSDIISSSSSSSSLSSADKLHSDTSTAQQNAKHSITSVSPPRSPARSHVRKRSGQNASSFQQALSKHDAQSSASHGHRATLTGSADSVEYETALLSDYEDEDDDSDNLSDADDEEMDETDSEEDAAEMRHLKSFQRAGSTIPVDVMKIVLSLRKQRNRGMVQTEDQYKFIYRVLFDEIHEQRLNVSGSVMQFMADAASDFTDAAPLSGRLSTGSSGNGSNSGVITSSTGGIDRSARRKSQPRSPRSTQVSLGSSVSIGASGLSRLSASTASNALSYSSSFSDDENERKARLKQSADTNYQCPLLSLDSSTDSKPPLTFAQRRNLAMSCANIQPGSSDSILLGRSNATTSSDSSGAPIFDYSRDFAQLPSDNFSLASIIAQQQQQGDLVSAPSSSFAEPIVENSAMEQDIPTPSRSPGANMLALAQSIDKTTVSPPVAGPRRSQYARRSTPPNTRRNNEL